MKTLPIYIVIILFAFNCKKDSNTIVVASQTPFDSLSYGLVAYYPMNGNANDQSRNGINASIHGATFTTGRNGLANNALSFNGVDNFVQIPDTSSLDFGSGDFSLTLWLRRDTSGVRTDILDKKDLNTYPSQHDYCLWVTAADTIGALFRQSISYYSEGDLVSCSQPIGKGWVHIAIVRDHSKLYLYINGVEKGTGYSTADISSNGPLRVGSNRIDPTDENGQTVFPMKGIVDELRIYNRPLGKNEIKNLSN